MPNRKYSFDIKKSEKELYRIFKDLEKYGRCAFSYPENRQHSVSRTIGERGQHLSNNNLLFPPRQIDKGKSIVALPIDVEIREKKVKGRSRFYFKRIF